jgi:hypothetical protein
MKRLLKVSFIGCAGVVGVLTLAVIVLILMNSRDPYGGPIEPAADH